MRTQLSALLQHDRAIVLAGLAGIAALSWVYLLHRAGAPGMAAEMDMGMGMSQPAMQPWRAADFALNFEMWWVMMIGMMVPSAAPMILTYDTLHQKQRGGQRAFLPVAMFLLGYLLLWGIFSAVATLAEWALVSAALLSPQMASTSPPLGGALLIVTGVFQWSPLKHACLSRCRTPLGFLLNEWREGVFGALAMGVRHGYYCVGCCSLLMALLFVAGIMNLLWVAIIAAFVLIEKVAPAYGWISRAAGVVMAVWGVVLIAGALV